MPNDAPKAATVQLPAVNAASVDRAARHLKLALDSEGFPGAMIYSQNCFQSLSRQFSWAKLDQCEAFDALAQLAISQSQMIGPEATYLGKAEVEGRFTKAASDRQGEPGSIENHLSELSQASYAKIADLQTEDQTADLNAVNTLQSADKPPEDSGSAPVTNDAAKE